MMDENEQKIPLWRQLQAVAAVLLAIRSGVSGTAAIADVASDLRPGVQALTFHVLRSLGRAEALRQMLASRTPPPPADGRGDPPHSLHEPPRGVFRPKSFLNRAAQFFGFHQHDNSSSTSSTTTPEPTPDTLPCQ